MTDGRAPAPSAAALLALDADAWAQLLPHLRATLASLDADARVEELRTAPVSRLAGGRLRAELVGLVADGQLPWEDVAVRLAAADELPPQLAELLAPTADVDPGVAAAPVGAEDATRSAQLRDRLRVVREERDTWQRRAAGAEARAAALQQEVDAAQAAAAATLRERDELAAAVERADAERERAVAREARRQQATIARLQDELAAIRREEEDRRLAARRAAQAERERAAAADREAQQAREQAHVRGAIKLVPGRPSALPATVRPETTEAARLLLHRGRLVLLDGYNLTLQHRGSLDLERQRGWLVQVAATLVAQRGIEPVLVFDGEAPGGTRGGPNRDVEVRFTPAGITADDEIVLAVEATDRPVVVVTDDRELTARVRVAGADVVPTRAFLGVAGAGGA